MEKKTTLNDLAKFYNKEKEYLNSIFGVNDTTVIEQAKVKMSTIKNIKSYSKILSVKHTKLIGKIDFVLN
jgi:hypothetical protein